MRKILNAVLFQVGWFACVIAGARGLSAVAIGAAAAVVAVHLACLSADRRRDALLIPVVALIGFCVDSACLRSGAFALVGAPRHLFLCPLWLVALWAVFATMLRGPLGWMAGRYGLAAVLGALGGPLSYLSGARLGAVTLHANRAFSVTVLAVTWAVVTPILIWLAHGRVARGAQGNCPA